MGAVQVSLSVRLGKLGSPLLGHVEHRVNVRERNESDKFSRDVRERGDLRLKFCDSAREIATPVFHAADLLTFRTKVLRELGGGRSRD